MSIDLFAMAEQNFRDEFGDPNATDQLRDLQEQEQQVIQAIRAALTAGVSMANIEILCAATGVNYKMVVG